jgi:isoleucyl-tRNA synthetase
VQATKAQGDKCPRCWHYSTEIGKTSAHPTICPKCIQALG